MIDIKNLRLLVQDCKLAGAPVFVQATDMNELLARLEAAEEERDFAKTEIARLHDDIRELTDERVLDEEDRELWTTLKAKSAEKENAKLREALVEEVVSETMLRDLSLGNGSINASFEGGAVHLFVDAFATQLLEQFLESGATNYLEMSFHSNVTGPLVVTLQRVNGKTAHQLRAEAEKERDALRVDKATLQQMLYSIKNRLEAAEKSDAESIAMYRKARDERDALRAELTDLRNSMTFRTSLIGRIEAEREDLHALIAAVKKQVNAEFRLRMKKEIECNALRANIEAMEKQEPFDADSDVFRSAFEAALKAGNWPATRQGDGYRSPSTQIAWRVAFSTVNRLKLYLAPGAKGE